MSTAQQIETNEEVSIDPTEPLSVVEGAGEDIVALVPSQLARSWPTVDPKKPWRSTVDVIGGGSYTSSFVRALSIGWTMDAHFAAYAGSRRLNTGALDARCLAELRRKCVLMYLFVVDIDGPNHQAPPEWRAVERAKLEVLRRVAPGFVTYDTRGGYRLIWRLSRPLPLRGPEDARTWSHFYRCWLSWLEQHTDIVGDPACADWTRLHRLLYVVRGGVEQRHPVTGNLSEGTWEWTRGLSAPANNVKPLIVVDEIEGEGAPVEVAARLMDQIVAELHVAGLWEDGRQRYMLSFLGWLLGAGWTRPELDQLVARLPRNAPYLGMPKRARPQGGPGVVKELLTAEGWARLDAAVNSHPNANARREAWKAEQAAATAEVFAPALAAAAQAAAASATVQAPPVPGTFVPATDESESEPKGSTKPLTTADVVNVLSRAPWDGVLGFDALANRVMCLRQPPMRPVDDPGTPCAGEWTDAHTTRARTWICEAKNWREPGKDATDAAVEIVARRQTYHPVQLYLARLRWDGVPRLDGMLSTYFGTELSDYTRKVGAKTLLAAVARASRPGCKVDTMLILEGGQGLGKSRSLRVLTPREEWFADTPLDLESKDAAQCLQGKWIYEIGELHSFNRAETTRIKAFVSSQADNLRPSYGRRNQDFPRQCIFIGTTNGSEYLSDTTGNRRYWPVRCRAIDVGGLERDRDQLWAEAATRYAQGERWWLEGAEVALAEAQQADRETVDPWEAQLAAWLEQQETGGAWTATRGFGMSDILAGALRLGVSEQSQATATRVGKLLAKLGWRSRPVKDPTTHKVVRVYTKVAT